MFWSEDLHLILFQKLKIYKLKGHPHPNESKTAVGLTNNLMVSVCHVYRIKNDTYGIMDSRGGYIMAIRGCCKHLNKCLSSPRDCVLNEEFPVLVEKHSSMTIWTS